MSTELSGSAGDCKQSLKRRCLTRSAAAAGSLASAVASRMLAAFTVTAFAFSNAAMAQYSQPAAQPPSQQAAPNPAPQSTDTITGPRAELYAGLDFASKGWFNQWVEGTQAPFGSTDDSGFRVRLYGEAGQYHYNLSKGLNEKETWFEADFLVGYAIEQEHLEAGFYVGTAVLEGILAIPDPSNTVQGSAFGPKVEAEFKWTDHSAMVAGEASYTTAFGDYSAKLQLGGEIFSNVYIGPEFTVTGDEMFHQWRVGGHATIMSIENLRVVLGAGYEKDSDNGPGMYGTLRVGVAF